MKNVLKFICSVICYTMFLPCAIMLSFCVSWYLLAGVQATPLGTHVLQYIGQQGMFILTMCAIATTLFFGVMGKIFNVIRDSKSNNFYTHLLTWMMAIALVVEAGYAFVASGDMLTTQISLDIIRKIGILACAFALLVYALIAPKVRKLVDRRIQAYDTAKELNANGRSSVVGMQILKCLDFICPEMFLLIALCFAFNWEVSLYFIYIICAFILPLVGNMICDKRVKKESIRNKREEHEALVNEVANAVSSQINATNS